MDDNVPWLKLCLIYVGIVSCSPFHSSRLLIFCSLTHNTRIKCLWVEVGRYFARSWHAFFTRLGWLYFLDWSNPHQLWLLHTFFLPTITHDCKQFQTTWNNHPISEKGRNMGPNVCILILCRLVYYWLILILLRTCFFSVKQNMANTKILPMNLILKPYINIMEWHRLNHWGGKGRVEQAMMIPKRRMAVMLMVMQRQWRLRKE